VAENGYAQEIFAGGRALLSGFSLAGAVPSPTCVERFVNLEDFIDDLDITMSFCKTDDL